jgi:hypothetical protein
MMFLSVKLKKPDVHILRKYSDSFVLLLITALLLFCNPVHSQSDRENDTIIKVAPGTYIQIRDSISFFLNDTLLRLPSLIIPAINSKKDKNLLYYDSLKVKASRKPLTKKLYDLVVISPTRLRIGRSLQEVMRITSVIKEEPSGTLQLSG